jgi:hypothetical protein
MAVLSAETNMAGVSELTSAIFLSSATLTGFYPNEIENGLRQQNAKISLFDHHFSLKDEKWSGLNGAA